MGKTDFHGEEGLPRGRRIVMGNRDCHEDDDCQTEEGLPWGRVIEKRKRDCRGDEDCYGEEGLTKERGIAVHRKVNSLRERSKKVGGGVPYGKRIAMKKRDCRAWEKGIPWGEDCQRYRNSQR